MDVSRQLTEFALGGLAACGAGVFTNPLEVVKTRMQLQGELSARGRHAVHYRHVFHGFVAIAKHDGVLALQKGLIPALWYQFFMNGFRLGCYQCIENLGLTRASDGNVSFRRSVLAGGLSGCLGALVGSPIYMIKTRLQSRSAQAIAVGHQHDHYGMWQALREVYSRHGLRGLWRGASGALARVLVGSSAQLSTFTAAKQYIVAKKTFKEGSWLNALFASMVSGCVATTCMTPFDVVSTRLYNQRVDHATGTGMLYKGVADCFRKTYAAEGLWGFYKGWTASFFRLGPHTVLSLVFWDRLRYGYFELLGRGLTKTS